MARITALIALTALELSDAPVHEPVHGRGAMSADPVTVCNIVKSVGAEYVRHYNSHRPHQSLKQESPLRQPGRIIDVTARIERRRVLGGLISEYHRAA